MRSLLEKNEFITATVEIIQEKDIPTDFYLPIPKKTKWKNIFKFTFSNNFTYYYGSNKSFVNCKDLLINVSLESSMVISSKNPFTLKKLFMETFNSNISIPNCKKIYNWYKNKTDVIEEILEQFLAN